MPRFVILGCGTAVGKTRVSRALLSGLATRGQSCLGLKPIESGVTAADSSKPPENSDAALLSAASTVPTQQAHPFYALRDAVSPHLAARNEDTAIDLSNVVAWVERAESEVARHVASDRALWSIVETAGGVLSPLGPGLTNFDLAQILEPAIWILVAADALGVLHDVSATKEALAARGRPADYLVLSQAREPDASTGTNADELSVLGIATPAAVLERNDDRGLDALIDRLLDQHRSRS